MTNGHVSGHAAGMTSEPKRHRSPNVPRFPLEQALEATKALHGKIAKARVKPEVAVGPLGYSGINGAALGALAALNQYGLIDRADDGLVSVSPAAIRMLHPVSDAQLFKDRRDAALKPRVFADLISHGFHKADADVIANHLIHNDFAAEPAKRAATIFKMNLDFAKLDYESIQDADIAPDNADMMPVKQPPVGPFVVKATSPAGGQRVGRPAESPAAYAAEALTLPLENGRAVTIPPMSEDDYNLLIETLKLWKRRIIVPKAEEHSSPTEAGAD